MFRHANQADLEEIARIYDELLSDEATRTFTNWQPGFYPSVDFAIQALRRGDLYIGEDAGGTFGTAILNKLQLDEYAGVPWKIVAADEEVGVIHTLCIRPSAAGKGYARTFVAFLEGEARRIGCTVMRLDTYEGNEPAIRMYPRLGYSYAGTESFLFLQRIRENLVLFEKDLRH